MFDREAYNKRVEWYQEARFGMFIHWGLYAIPARGEWVRSIEEIPEEEYLPFFDEFDPVDYDPKKWARAAKEAGMKYAVLTAKHHDGFCLFDSELTDFKATNTKAGRDLIAEYLEAFRAEGIKVGIYYSIIDWHHPDYPHYGDRIHPLRNCEAEKEAEAGRNFDRYLEYMHGQVKELCTRYGKIDVMWFDFSYDNMTGEKWHATELVNMIRTYQPDVIIDNRLEVSGEGFGSLATDNPSVYSGDFVSPEQIIPPQGLKDESGRDLVWEACITMNDNWGYCAKDNPSVYSGDFVSPEQIIPPQGLKDESGRDLVWEACITMNDNWGYCAKDKNFKPASMIIKKLVECVSKNGNMLLNVGPDAKGNIPEESLKILEEKDKNFKPASMIIKKLVECVSKNGNMLLNVGPDAKGNIPEESLKILEEIGKWMKKNSKSIYGCKGSALPKPENGRITQKGNKVYYHIMENSIGGVPLYGINREQVEKVRLLSDGSELQINGRITQKGNKVYYHIMENSIGGVPLYGINREQVEKVRLLSDGSELQIIDFWTVNNYPDVVFVDVSSTPYLPDETDTVVEITLKEE